MVMQAASLDRKNLHFLLVGPVNLNLSQENTVLIFLAVLAKPGKNDSISRVG
jgi:hypothetical protein